MSSRTPGKCRQAGCPSLSAGQPGTLLRLSRRGNGAGDASGPAHTSGSPRPPNPLDETTSVRLGRFPVPSHVQRKPRAGSAFPGPGSRFPLLHLSRGYSPGKTRRICPTPAKRGVRGSLGSSKGSETRRSPRFSPLTGDKPMLPARVAAVGVSVMLQGKEWE